MGAKQLQAIATQLIDEEGWAFNTPVLLTYNVSRQDEQTFETTLWELRNGEKKDLPTPLIALIGNVAGLKHHQASDIKPTLYTGTLPDIEKRNADYTYTPLIEINNSSIFSLKDALYDEENYEYYKGKGLAWDDDDEKKPKYVVFTSQHSISSTIECIPELLEEQENYIFISIGDTTTEALHNAGIKDVIQVEEDNRFGIIKWFEKEKEKYDEANARYEDIIYPHSSLSPEDIPLALQELGFSVKSFVAYKNVMPEHPRLVNLNHFKRIVFTSPSTIDNFIKLYGKLPENTEFITRGPITQKHLEEVLEAKSEV